MLWKVLCRSIHFTLFIRRILIESLMMKLFQLCGIPKAMEQTSSVTLPMHTAGVIIVGGAVL